LLLLDLLMLEGSIFAGRFVGEISFEAGHEDDKERGKGGGAVEGRPAILEERSRHEIYGRFHFWSAARMRLLGHSLASAY
jgi:hypothetical protein